MDRKELAEHREVLLSSREQTIKRETKIAEREAKLSKLKPATIKKRLAQAALQGAQLMQALSEAPRSKVFRTNQARAWTSGKVRIVNIEELGTFLVDHNRTGSKYTLQLIDGQDESTATRVLATLATMSGDVRYAGAGDGLVNIRETARLEEELETVKEVSSAAGLDVDSILATKYESQPVRHGK